MDNFTFEELPFGKLGEDEIPDYYDYDSVYYTFDIWSVIMRIMEVGLTGGSVLACILLVYVILKFSYLKTRINIYIMHFAICYIMFLIFTPMYQLISMLGLRHIVNGTFVCMVELVDAVSVTLVCIFSTVLSIDWLIIMFKSSLEKYENIQNYIILVLYSAGILEYIILITPCFHASFIEDISLVMAVPFITMVAIVLITNCITFFRKHNEENLKHKYELTIASYLVLSWIPILILYFLTFRLYIPDRVWSMFILFVTYVFMFILYSGPIVVTIWINHVNYDFRKAFDTIFRRVTQKNQDDLDENDGKVLIENEGNQEYTSPILI